MGLDTPRIYLDSCIAIYLVEEYSAFAPIIESLLENHSDYDLCISDLTVMECLVGPLRTDNTRLENKFLRWFESVIVLPITNVIFRDAARLRAVNPALKTPDAIHLASSFHYKCDEFWTNDIRLDRFAPTMVRNIL